MTNGWTDVRNADVVLIMGGNPAENHPVGFRFAMQAKKNRKAKLVCVDPRFTRTAAVSDKYVQMRSGSDIAFLGGLIHHSLETGQYHEEYVREHTNASFLVDDEFGFEDGLFSGWDSEAGKYDKSSWGYQKDGRGYARIDKTLENPRSVFQLLRRHYSRYTPEAVANICGCSAEEFTEAAKIVCSTGVAGRSGTILYALGWTQHSHSVQLIHTAAMLQLLLGNVGMPGGGINAQRGHSNIQGATDMGAWDKLPGYLNAPRADWRTLAEYNRGTSPQALRPDSLNYWSNTPKFMTSLLKAYYGANAKRENDFGYGYMPKHAEGANHGWGYLFDKMYAGDVSGLIAFGMNPVANGPNSKKMIAALGKLDWLIVAENFETETAAFWDAKKLAGEYYPSAVDPSEIQTEVFLLPAACFAEKDGAFVNSSRWLQWKSAAADPPGEALPDQEIVARLFLEVRRLYEEEAGANPEPVLSMQWPYGNQVRPDLAEVAKEINGRQVATGDQVSGFGELKDDGSTLCGNWLYSGSYTEDGNQMARRGQNDSTGLGLYADWAWSWPANRRVLYNRASADADGKPWDATRAPIQWRDGRYVGDVPDYKADAPPDANGAFIMLPEGVARLYAPGLVEGPFPEHYEPAESPVENALHPAVSSNPTAIRFNSDADSLGDAAEYPYVAVTYRLTEHYHYWTKHVASSSTLQSTFFVEISQDLAEEEGLKAGDQIRVSSARGHAEGPVLITKRMRKLTVSGKPVFQVGLPIHWGFLGRVKGPLVNNLTPSVMDPNSGTPEYKGFLVKLEKL